MTEITVAEAGDWVWLARIRRPQGRKGEVFADILTDFPQKFAERRQLWLLPADPSTPNAPRPGVDTRETTDSRSRARPIELTAYWLHKGGVVLHFAGVDSISAAETLAGLAVAIPRTERVVLGDDETYVADLVGSTLFDVAGGAPIAVGEIEDIDRTAGPVPLLIVRAATGEVLIPFAKSYLRKIDVAARRVEMALPEGLVDLNEPEKS
jgi:16S rRNA processing protein RimM